MDEISTEPSRPHWTLARLAAGAALVLVAVLATFDAWSDIFRIAIRDEEASQVLLVPAVVAWLLATRREQIRASEPRYSMAGPLLIALGWAVSWVGYHNAIQAFWHGGAVLIAVGAFLSVAGLDVLRRLWPVFLVLLFLVPVPSMARQSVAMPLQTATASATQFVFELLGMDVVRSGNVLTYRGVEVAVAEACNGMRMVFVLLLVCYAVAFASPLRPPVRALILLVSPIAAILCNVIRLVPTVWLYGYHPETWAPLFHDVSGWAMIVVAFLLVMGLIRLLQWVELPVMQPGRSPAAGAGAGPRSVYG